MGTLTLGRVMIAFGADVKGFQSGVQKVNQQLKKTTTATKKADGSMKTLTSTMGLAAAAYTAVAVVATKALVAWGTQERSVNQLNLALANQGNLLPGVSKALQDQASALQLVTTFGDEAILQGQALLATSGLTADKMKEVTPLILDFASAQGMDLKSAFMLVTKAAQGQASALGRYGLSVTKGKSDTEQFNEVITQMSDRFSGFAEVAAKDSAGALTQIGNAMGDVFEQAGKLIEFLLGTFGVGVADVTGLIQTFGKFLGENLIITLGALRMAFGKVMGFIIGVVGAAIGNIAENFEKLNNLPGIGRLIPDGFVARLQLATEKTKALAEGFSMTGDALLAESMMMAAASAGSADLEAKLIKTSAAHNDNTNKVDLATEAHRALGQMLDVTSVTLASTLTNTEVYALGIEEIFLGLEENTIIPHADVIVSQAQREIEVRRLAEESAVALGIKTSAASEKMAKKIVSDVDNIIAAYGRESTEGIAAKERLDKFRQESQAETDAFTTSSFLGATADMLGGFAALGEGFKVFAIAQAVIATYLAIAKAMTTLPWPMNLVSAAGAGAAGFANVAKIRSSPAAQFGSPGLDFQNFGAETNARLHGNEAIIPQGSGHRLASEIASAMNNPTTAMSATSQGAEGGGGGGGDITIRVPINIDGKMIDEIVETRTKSGSMRVFSGAVREF